jgi:preprotein translocase subunit SecE
MNKISTYFRESYKELLEKVSWPSWNELQQSTVIVLVATLLITLIVWIMDLIQFCAASWCIRFSARRDESSKFFYDGNMNLSMSETVQSTRKQEASQASGGNEVVCPSGSEREGAEGERVPGQGDFARRVERDREAGISAGGEGI